jgi:hypothetical protein
LKNTVNKTGHLNLKAFKLKCAFLQSGKQRGKGGKPTGKILPVGDESLKRKNRGEGQKSLGK